MSNLELIKAIDEGTITPEEALRQSEHPGTFLGDISVSHETEPLNCGFSTWDSNMYLREKQGDFIVVAARPGAGKSSFAAQIGSFVSNSRPVLMFSLEMTKEEIKKRFLAQATGRAVNSLKFVKKEQLQEANDKLLQKKLIIDDTNGLEIGQLMSRAIDVNRQHKLSLVIVDYLQIVPTNKPAIKAEQVAEVCEKLKNLAKLLSCPVLALAQMNRMFDMRLAENPVAEPIMADLADSSGIERWTDLVVCLHKPHPDMVKGFVLKNRNGPATNFSMQFHGTTLKYTDRGPEVEGI